MPLAGIEPAQAVLETAAQPPSIKGKADDRTPVTSRVATELSGDERIIDGVTTGKDLHGLTEAAGSAAGHR